MPKLLIFAPCEKVIIDDQKNASLIILLQNVTASPFDQTEIIPKNAVAPQYWTIFTTWQPFPEDIGKHFAQVTQILWPDGSEFKKHAQPFQLEQGKVHQISIRVVGFPIGQVGTLTLNMWLEQDSCRVGETYSFSINVSHGQAS